MNRTVSLILSKDIQAKLIILIKATESNIYTKIEMLAKRLFTSFQASRAFLRNIILLYFILLYNCIKHAGENCEHSEQHFRVKGCDL